MAAFISFWLLFLLSLLHPQQRQYLRLKPVVDWVLDGVSLCCQGAVIPLLQYALLIWGYERLFPQAEGILDWHPILGFVIGFIAVDYLYYWVHRGLHRPGWFAIHAVHHTLTQMDMVSTARNTLWSSLFLPYLWANSLMLYLLADPRGYFLAIALTYFLDLCRHSCFTVPTTSRLFALLNPWLILPQDHATHHSRYGSGNFGANWKLWDKLHHTDTPPLADPLPLGIDLPLTLVEKLWFPFRIR